MKIVVKIDGQPYEVEIEDINARPVKAYVNGQYVEVTPDEPQLITPSKESTEFVQSTPSTVPLGTEVFQSNSKIVTAPLPGVIVSLDVKNGQKVEKGQILCTLEAMKMKNAIRSSRDGTIAEIMVSIGEQVKHSQPLVSFVE